MSWLFPLIGGVLIGFSVTIMLILHGRVTGISGIINNVLISPFKDSLWRWTFIIGLILGGLIMSQFSTQVFYLSEKPLWVYCIAGLLVGLGTTLGSGCTSGHGVCGVSRLSMRSIVATFIFIFFGILTTWIGKFL